MTQPGLLTHEAVGSSVFQEITRNFRATLRACKSVLGDKHPLTTACLHASLFPTDRMSFRMVWDQFEALSFAQRAEMMEALRNQAFR